MRNQAFYNGISFLVTVFSFIVCVFAMNVDKSDIQDVENYLSELVTFDNETDEQNREDLNVLACDQPEVITVTVEYNGQKAVYSLPVNNMANKGVTVSFGVQESKAQKVTLAESKNLKI